MSVGSSLSGITFSGIGSGIDTDSIISRLMQLEQIPITRIQKQQAQLTQRMGLMSQLKGLMVQVQSSSNALNSAAAFQNVTSSSSNEQVATVSTTDGAVAGTYALSVSKLAQAHKVSSSAQLDTTTALGYSGSFVVNGKGINVVATDSLTGIAQKINEANAGVTASLINGGSGNSYLSLTANKSGASNEIQLANSIGSVLGSLGFVSGAPSVRETITNGATSFGFSSASTAVGTMLNATGLGPEIVTINGFDVSVDLSTQSLQDVANSINAAGTGASATVRSVTDSDGVTTYKLDIAGAGTPTFAEAGSALSALGVLQSGFDHQLVEAQDASYKLDGVSFTSSSNTISTVIPNVTINLLKANEVTPETSTLTLSQNNEAIKDKVKQFQDAFNSVVDFIRSASSFDKDTFAAGPLFGDAVARQVEQILSDNMFANVDGLSSNYTNLTQIGFSFDKDGKLALDESMLDKALNTSSSSVANLFRARGESTGAALQFVSSTDKTKASGVGVYSVVITQAATKSSYTAETAQTTASAVTETLTFNGTLFGSTPYNLVLSSGSDLAANIATINNDSKLKDLVVATNEGGKLVITAKKWGTNGGFTVTSDLAAAADNSGVGNTSSGVKVDGVDVVGTINGEETTGSGQFLTGKSGNATTDGLQVMYTGDTLGAVGDIRFTKGMGSLMASLVSEFTDSVSGLMTANDNALQEQFDTMSESISTLQSRLTLKEQDLRKKFAAMEEAIASMQSQQSSLSAMFSSISKK